MNKKLQILFILLFICPVVLNAATITSTLTGNWSNLSTWNSTVIPGPGDDVIISGGKSVTVNGNYTVNSITVGAATGTSNTLLMSTGFSLTVSNTITIVPASSGTNTNLLDAAAGYILCAGLNSTDSGNSSRDCKISISTGTLIVNGNAILGPSSSKNSFTFSGNGLFKISGSFTGGGTITSALGNVEYNGTSQTINSSFTAYNNFTLSNSGTKISSASFSTSGDLTVSGTATLSPSGAFTVTGNLSLANSSQLLSASAATFSVGGNISVSGASQLIAPSSFSVAGNTTLSGTSQLDCSVNSTTSNFKGNFIVTSTNTDPFVEGTGLVRLNGSAGTQTISTVLAGGESFNKLIVANTFSSNPSIIFPNNVSVNEDYDHSSGFIDIKGKSFACAGANTANQTFSLSGNSGIISSIAGATFSISQGAKVLTVFYNGFQVGDATNGITTNMTSDFSEWIFSTFYGSTNFIKTGATENIFGGGNIFYGPCAFTTNTGASRWRMGDDGSGTAPGDTYYNGTFTHNGSSNLIMACNSNNNHFYGTTTLNSSTAGGVYITRQNGTQGSYSAMIHGPIIVNVSLTGSVYFADATTNYSNTVTFENTIQLNSLASSTGDIQFGTTSSSSVALTSTAQFIAGSISGRTSVYLRKLTQTGNLLQTISGSVPNSKLFCGTAATTPCTFNGPTAFNLDTISVQFSTFNANANFTGNAQHTLNTNIFNGSSNTFTKNGANSNTTSGGNVFIAGSSNVFTNNGAGYWRLANTTADDYNGDVTFVQTSTGTLAPTYNTNSTFAGNISTVGTTTALEFGSNGGRVIIDGTGSQTISGSSSFKPSIRRLTMSVTGSGTLTLNVPVDVSVDLTTNNGLITTTSTNSLTLISHTVTSSVGNANSYVNGPLCFNVLSSSAQVLDFPIGKGGSWRPITLSPRNSVSTSITYKAESFSASARTFSWTLPPTVNHVSDVSYWDVDRSLTSSGAALPTQSLTGNQAITLYYLTSDVVTDPSNLTICKNTSTATTTWIDIGGSGASSGAGSVSSTSAPTAFTTYSRFTLGNKNAGTNPLPIELLIFTATKNKKQVDLKWETAAELNNDYFEVEKSRDGINFETLTMVKGAGNSNTHLSYSTTDQAPYKGISYYRLNQVDFNKKNTYSPMQSVEFNNSDTFTFDIYPNPNDGSSMNLILDGSANGEVLVVVYDVIGKESFTKVLITNESENSVYAIDTANRLAPGIYMITATSKQAIYSKKLIIN